MKKATRSILRTKTGCLTCRQRRMKCDEGFPRCGCCRFSKRNCQWPTRAELLDRRFASHCQSRHRSPRAKGERTSFEVRESTQSSLERDKAEIAHREYFRGGSKSHLQSESGTAHVAISRQLELVISRHFVERYAGLTLLPSCHPSFSEGWLGEVQHLMASHRSVYYSVLACAASHIHLSGAGSSMQELVITYYSNAISEMSSLLTTASQWEHQNALLISVILLYVHGCIGLGTYSDVPRHVNAATQILKLRQLNGPINLNRLLDRLAIESVLYQVFLTTVGLWSDFTLLDFNFDAEFWAQAEGLLDRWRPFPDSSASFNSPVMGIPVSLFRLTLLLRHQWQTLLPINPAALEQIQADVKAWEIALLCEQEPRLSDESKLHDHNPQERYYKDTGWLYVIIASLLLEQLPGRDDRPCYPQTVSSNSWQIRTAIQILRKYGDDDGWARFFIGNWPVYTLGLFTSSDKDKQVIKDDLQHRWELTKFTQNTRYSQDLAGIWHHEAKDAPILSS